jgi:DNA-binding winged helix-turn-helix (wHTH) protein/TolB-like protein/Tfp pilus assembly protein PilF
MNRAGQHFYEFGPFRLEAVERRLLRGSELVALTPKTFELLLALVQNSGHVLGREELMQRLWPDVIVEESNLTQNIFALRKTLGDGADGQRYIETVPKRGYRFVAEVKEQWDEEEVWQSLGVEGRASTAGQESVGTGEIVALTPAKTFAPAHSYYRSLIHSLAPILLVGVVITLAYAWAERQPRPAATESRLTSIAVLPFRSLESGRDEYLGLGIADALITKLGGLRRLVVRPTGTMRKYSNPEQDPLAVGREQKVDAVLDASFQREGERIRVTARLLRVADGDTLWTYQCDEQQCTNIFALQDAISEKVAGALALQLTGEERGRLRKHYTENQAAYQEYLKGRYFWDKRTVEGYKKATEHFQRAIAIDPNYAQAYVGLADCFAFFKDKAKEQLVKALELDDTLAEAHASLAFNFKFCAEWDWAGAEQEFKRAIELNPNSTTAHDWYAYYLAARGRLDEAIAEVNQAHALDPLSVIINTDVGEFFYYARQYDRAIAAYRQALELDPNFGVARYLLGYAYEQKGMYEQAIAEFQKAIPLLEDEYYGKSLTGWLGHCYAVSGKRDEAVKILDELRELAKKPGVRVYGLAFQIASIYTGLGDKDRAFEWLEKEYAGHDYNLIQVTMDPRNDSLRSDPRFTDLLRRMRLSP